MLTRLQSLPEPIRIAIVGIGSVGNGLVFQSQLTPNIDTVAIADIKIERAIACAEWLKRDYQVVDTLGAMHDAIGHGRMALCQDGRLLGQCDVVDLMMEATSAIGEAGRHAEVALQHGKHVVMMNYEADMMFGPYLLSLAREKGVVYTGCDGDQPAVLKRMIDDLEFWGFELVMAGNMKGFLDRYANPTSIVPEADKRRLDYKMCTSYTDGTKLCVEMAALANALGLRTAVPGMIGPKAKHVLDVFHLFNFDSLWQDRQAVVDYVLGAEPSGGVFAIGYTADEFQQFYLDWFPSKMGPGPFYVFYRPYHLSHIEAMACVVEAVLDGKAVLQPIHGFQTNVYAYAKRLLRAGETLDGVGGYTCYGLIENCADNRDQPGLPICLATDVTLKRDVSRDERILLVDVDLDPGRPDVQLYSQAVAAANKEFTRQAN